MCETVRPEFPFSPPGTILRAGVEYEAVSNKHGAISGICENGERLGVKPGEFAFVSAPSWIVQLWVNMYPECVAGAIVED